MFTTRDGNSGRQLAGMLVITAMLLVGATGALAQDAPGGVPAKKTSAEWLEDFFYYLDVGRWDLCAASGQKFLEGKPTPNEVYRLIQKTKFRAAWQKLLKALQVNEPSDGSTMTVSAAAKGITDLWKEGVNEQAFKLESIVTAIEMLDDGERSYQLGIARLRVSGLYAVPVLVSYLTNSEKAAMRPVVERALGDLDRSQVVGPMTAALKIDDDTIKLALIRALRNLPFRSSLAALQEVATDKTNRIAVRGEAAAAVARISRSPRVANTPAAELYLQLATMHYNDNPRLRPDVRQDPTAIYTWDATTKSLVGRRCSLSVYMAVMAQRCCEAALALERNEKAVSQWLSAVGLRDSIKAKVLAENPDATVADPGMATGQGDAEYYYFSSGQTYLFSVLDRSIRDGQLAVALRALKGLRNVATASGLRRPSGAALSRALRFANRRIRVHAAFVGAAINPKKAFLSSEQVVPALGDALSRPKGRRAALVLRSDRDVNALKVDLEKQQLSVVGATSMDRVLLGLMNKANVDVFFISEKVGTPNVGAAYRKIRQHARFGQATIVILASTGSLGQFVKLEAADKNLAVVAADTMTPAGLVRAYHMAEAAAGRSPLSGDEAKALALKAAAYLKDIADAGNKEVFNAADALTPLLAALEAKADMDIRKAAATVLARIESSRAQQALAGAALDAAEKKEIRVAALSLLGDSARRFGVLIDGKSVAALVKLATEEADLAIRTPAGKAVGSMNLDSVKMADLILKFVK